MKIFCYNENFLILLQENLFRKEQWKCAIKQKEELKNSKIIVTSIIHDKELVLNTGADLYLPKPYEIPQLIKWVDSFIKEFND